MKHMMIKVLSLVMALTMIMGMFGAVAVSAAGHTHTKGEKVKTVAPTCVAYGYTLYECASCGEQYADDVLPKTEECQNIEDVPAVEATCTTDAKTAGKKCKDCDKYVEGGDPVPNTKLGHNYDIMLIQPTCTEAGAVIEACTRCYDAKKAWTAQVAGAVKNNENLMVDEDGVNLLPPLNGAHDYVYIITVAPTCSEAGRATYKCAKCDEVTIENIYVAPSEALHNWVDVKDEPTCTTAGLDGKECTECWAYRSNVDTNGDGLYDMKDAVPATNHKNAVAITADNKAQHLVWLTQMGFDIEDLTKAETCTEAGYDWKYCPDCKSYVKFDKEALGHTLPNMADEKLVKAVIEAVKNKEKGASVEVTDEKGNKYSFVIASVANCEKGTVIACARGVAPYNCKETITLDNALAENHEHTWPTTPENPKADSTNWDYTAPTCTTAGWVEVTCTKENCGAKKTINVVNALGHDLEYTGDDCTSANGIVVTCKRTDCTATFDAIKNTTHTTVVKKIPATCNTYAYDADVCTTPGCKYSVAVDANKDGKADKVYTEEGFDATNHSAKIKVEGAYYVPATCVTEGVATYACKNCAAPSWTAVLPKITDPEHKWVKIEQVDPTCQDYGRTAGYICLTCADDEDLSAQLAAENKEITDVKADAEVPYKFGVAEENEFKGKLADGTDYTVPAGEKYVWVSGGMTIAKDSTKHVVKTIKFHRVGTCTMPELYLYECECGATWSKEGEKDAKNHNTYVYNALNQVITASSTFVAGTVVRNNNGTPDDATDDFDEVVIPAAVAGKHWGALLTYVAAKPADCTTAGNHNYVKCTGCSEVVEVSGKKIEFTESTGTYEVTNTWECVICKNYYEDQIKANDNDSNTKSANVVACPGFTLTFKNSGKSNWAVDKMTWVVDIKATGHKTEVVKATVEDCDTDGYTEGLKCVNAHCSIAPSVNADGTTARYVSGHVLIPAHAGRYDVTLKAAALLAPTCTVAGVGERVYYYYENVADTEDTDGDGDVEELIPVKKVGDGTQEGGEWVIEATTYCEVCDSRITDVTKKDYYIAPLGHDLVELDNYKKTSSCVDIGFDVYKCSRNCSNGSVWADINANGKVDVVGEGFETEIDKSEYTWFITNYKLATSHEWPEYDLEDKATFSEGWYIDGQILTTEQFKAAYNNFEPTKCLVDQVYYIACKCGERVAIDDVIPATGHTHKNGDIKTPISTDCTEIEKWIGFTCADCGIKIYNDTYTTHNLVVVTTKTTCTNDGLRYWACSDCDKAFYPVKIKDVVVSDETPTYEFYKNEIKAVDWNKDAEADLATLVYKCPTKFAKIDEYVKATATEDGYFKYTCQTCGETVTKVLEAGSDVQFTINAADVLGSKVTANGNQIVVSIAYTAKSYKFRTLNTTFFFDNTALAFDKAEVKLTFAEELAVTTDVSVDEDYIDILTAVNVAKGEAELKGEDVAYVDLYFTVLYPSEEVVDEAFGYVYVEALIYNENGKLVEDIPNVQAPEIVNDIVAVVTGDVAPDYVEYDEYTYYSPVLNVTDLVALMDMVYTADAEYVAAADINKDGKIDIDDYAALRTFTASKQTVEDYATMMGVELAEVDYATMIIDALRVQKIDLNNDGIVNAIDYEHLVANSYNSYLETLYDYDMTKDPWEYYFLFSTELTVEDITDEVLWTYEEYLDSLKVEEEPTPEVTPEQPAPEVTPETPAPEEGEGNLE